jgi:3-oxoadipate enol-lactonase/4-carboxymuconolactone decarboxylase
MPEVQANSVRLRYELTGPPDAPVVVFSHSIGASLEMWEPQVADFAGRYRVLRYDTRGHGGSGTLDRLATIDDLADDLAGLLDALGIARAHIVGLSLGGMVGQAFALRYPERLDRLVLIATTARMDPAAWRERADIVRREGYEPFVDAILTERWFTPAFLRDRPEVIAAFRRRFVAHDRAGYISCCHAIETLDLPARIHAIAAPTMIMLGADDPTTPLAMSLDLHARIPGAELVVIPGLMHLLTVERPDLTDPYITAFLDRGRLDAREGGTSFESGLANRKAVLGAAYVDKALAAAGAFGGNWQDFITRTAWGEVWGDHRLPWKTRSIIVLAMMIALHREEEFKLHLRGALRNGVTLDELKALIVQGGAYAGIPASNAAMRWSREVLGDILT